MNKHFAWFSGIALAVALSVGLIVPAIALESPTVTEPTAPVAAPTAHSTDDFAPKTTSMVAVAQPAKKASKPAVKKATVRRATAKTSTGRKSTTKASTSKKTSSAAKTASSSSSNDLATAKSVLASLQAKYQYLSGVTVTIGKTPNNYQAVSYMARGLIVISPSHKASISTILKHEIWHIIDYRDNGKIDWGERVAPKNAADYLK